MSAPYFYKIAARAAGGYPVLAVEGSLHQD
jgi:hypothetical protein